MNEHERYKQAFAKLDTRVTPAQIRALAEAEKGAITMKHRKPLRTFLIAAAVVLLLAGTVAAAGYYAGWLTTALPNAEEESEFLEKTVEPDASVELCGQRWTVNKVLAEGSQIYVQYTLERLDGGLIPEDWWEEHTVSWTACLLDANGYVQAITGADAIVSQDFSDPAKVVVLCNDDFDFDEEINWENASLRLYAMDTNAVYDYDDRYGTEVCTVPVEAPTYRDAVLEDGKAIRFGKVTVELALDLTNEAYSELAQAGKRGVYLSDGTFVGISESHKRDERVHMCLDAIIDPNDVTAFAFGGVTYKVS